MSGFKVFSGDTKTSPIPGSILNGIWFDEVTDKHYLGYTPMAMIDDSPVSEMRFVLGTVTSWN